MLSHGAWLMSLGKCYGMMLCLCNLGNCLNMMHCLCSLGNCHDMMRCLCSLGNRTQHVFAVLRAKESDPVRSHSTKQVCKRGGPARWRRWPGDCYNTMHCLRSLGSRTSHVLTVLPVKEHFSSRSKPMRNKERTSALA